MEGRAVSQGLGKVLEKGKTIVFMAQWKEKRGKREITSKELLVGLSGDQRRT